MNVTFLRALAATALCVASGCTDSTDSTDVTPTDEREARARTLVRVLEADRQFPPVPHHPAGSYALPADRAAWVERLTEKLRSARTKEVLIFAREVLSDLGEAALPVLEREVLREVRRSDSAGLAFVTNVVHALALEPDPAAAPLLARLLDHPLPNIRQTALQGLRLPEEGGEALELLLRRVEALSEDPIRTTWTQRCLRGLSALRTPGTLALAVHDVWSLERQRQRKHPNLQNDEAFRMIAALAPGRDPRVGELFERMLRDDAYRPYHRQVVDATPLLADRARAIAILRVATQEDRRDRRYVFPLARRALAVLGDERTLETYRDQVGREGTAVPDGVEGRVQRVFWARLIPALLGVSGVGPEGERWNAVRGLRDVRRARRAATAEAFLALGMAGRAEELVPFLQHRDADLRAAAWNACGFAWRRRSGHFPPDVWPAEPIDVALEDRGAWVERLGRALLDEDERVRAEAGRQAVLLDLEEAFDVYRDVLRSGETRGVRDALTTLVRSRPRRTRFVPVLLERLRTAPEAERWMVLQAAAPLAKPEDHRALLDLVASDAIWDGREVAPVCAVLCRDLGRDAVDALIERARSAPDLERRLRFAETLAAAAVKESGSQRIAPPRWATEPSAAARFLLEEIAFEPATPVATRLELLQRAPFFGGTAVASLLHARFDSDRIGPGERAWLRLILDDFF